ncbi:tetratricopeptide repeat protein [Chamaesiphon sp.]|uniref:tetratricopeptide repeat protein n=1 Tax=Chamaesiphon sp. TaxID=2814140 RepID=UPI0035937B8C
MSTNISLWIRLIGIGAIVNLSQPIAIAKSLGEVANTARINTVSIATTRGGSGNYFSSASRKYNSGDYRGALADYNRAIKSNPNSANAYYNRGLIKATKLQDERGALADYNRAIQLKPNYDAAYNNRGNLKVDKLQDYQGGLADYNRAIQLKPRNADAFYNRGVLKYTFLKDLNGGITDMQQAAKLSQKQGNTDGYQAASDLLNEWRSN